MKKTIQILITIVLSFILSYTVFAQDTSDDVEPSNYGIGFQGTFPAYGISGMMDLTETISVQAILGPFGNLKTFAGRGLYRFQHDEYWDLYGFGMLGLWTYDYINNETESSIGLGAGAGIEYDWRVLDEGLPPLFFNLELGVGFVDLEFYDFSTVLFGAGVHYKF